MHFAVLKYWWNNCPGLTCSRIYQLDKSKKPMRLMVSQPQRYFARYCHFMKCLLNNYGYETSRNLPLAACTYVCTRVYICTMIWWMSDCQWIMAKSNESSSWNRRSLDWVIRTHLSGAWDRFTIAERWDPIWIAQRMSKNKGAKSNDAQLDRRGQKMFFNKVGSDLSGREILPDLLSRHYPFHINADLVSLQKVKERSISKHKNT